MAAKNMAKKKQPGAASDMKPSVDDAAQSVSDEFREEDPTLTRRFHDQQPRYEQLGSEVAYTLNNALKIAGIKVAAVTHRSKELDSFRDKIKRKSYNDPFNQIKDFAGVRVVCYYADSFARMEELIGECFEITERENKTENAGIDRFGYDGIHFLIRLSEKSSGARYDELKGLICEIQVRTVMQDAWAVLSHHLMYKREDDIPDHLKRRVHALAGSLDSADFAFQAVREKRDQYIELVAASTKNDQIHGIRIDQDSLISYLKSKFPSKPLVPSFDRDNSYIGKLLDKLRGVGHVTLDQLDSLLRETEAARQSLQERLMGHSDSIILQQEIKSSTWDGIASVYILDRNKIPEMNPSYEREYLIANEMFYNGDHNGGK